MVVFGYPTSCTNLKLGAIAHQSGIGKFIPKIQINELLKPADFPREI
jgi:hypothetical protein